MLTGQVFLYFQGFETRKYPFGLSSKQAFYRNHSIAEHSCQSFRGNCRVLSGLAVEV